MKRDTIFLGISLALAAALIQRGGKKPRLTASDKRRAFILKIWDAANNLSQSVGWPRDLIITVAAHESNWGRSGLTQRANNLFGFKSSPNWLRDGGEYVEMPTGEVIDGKRVTVQAKFRKYPTWEASIKDYIRLITTRSRYNKAAEKARDGDLPGYFHAVKEAGYATDPAYPAKLARVLGEVKTVIA